MSDTDRRYLNLSREEKDKFDDAMEAHAARLMNTTFDPPKPAPDGFAHWPTQPHGAADVHTPHFVARPEESSEETEETLGAA